MENNLQVNSGKPTAKSPKQKIIKLKIYNIAIETAASPWQTSRTSFNLLGLSR